jgi:sec-independent protein translocase protein TatA
MPGFVGLPELLLLGLVVLLVFGPKRLPEMGRSMGRGLREFKNSVSSDDDGLEIAAQQRDAEQLAAASSAEPPAGRRAA